MKNCTELCHCPQLEKDCDPEEQARCDEIWEMRLREAMAREARESGLLIALGGNAR